MTREDAIEKVRQMSLPKEMMEILEALAPELRESEDERIRKDLITYLKSVQGETLDLTISVPKWIAYLEKQKVIAAIPDELVECYKNLCEISQDILINSEEDKQIDEITHDVRSLLDYPIKQKPAEWSEEDEKTFWGLTAYVPEEELKRLGVTRDDILKKLKSIRPSWKPSEEQMEALKRTTNLSNFGLESNRRQILLSLYEQLKKLM